MNTELLDPRAAKVVQLLRSGIESLQKAGVLVSQMIDDGMSHEQIAKDSEYLTPQMVLRLEQVGRNALLPRLLVETYPAVDFIERLPISLQQKVTTEPLEILLLSDSGNDTLKVEARHLTKSMCRQIFDGSCVRSIAAQRAYLESKAAKSRIASIAPAAPYQVTKGRLVVESPCEFTRQQILTILQQMER